MINAIQPYLSDQERRGAQKVVWLQIIILNSVMTYKFLLKSPTLVLRYAAYLVYST